MSFATGSSVGLIMPIGKVVRSVGLPAACAIIKSTTSSAVAVTGDPKVGSGPSMSGGV